METAQGREWIVLRIDELHGMILLYGGDDTEFVANQADGKGNAWIEPFVPSRGYHPIDRRRFAMPTKVTRDILEAFLHCKYKAYLKLIGQQGSKSDYETMLNDMKAEVTLAAIDKIIASHPMDNIPRTILLTTSALKKRAAFLLDATLEDDFMFLHFDGVKRIDGPSKLGDFHYAPVLYSERAKVSKEQRSLLAIYGLLLSRLQGQMPVYGIIWHGKECKAMRVRINADMRKTERLLRDVKDICSAESPQSLTINDHCQVCEFRRRCHDQAMQDDNLSLLRGLGEKEIRGYARKGILAVTQLAHTFRPRRRGKRATPKTNHRYHSLQALALRDKRVYVFGTPQLPNAAVRIYLDIEGNTENNFDYLIGMLIVEGDKEQHFSFWANTEEEEDCVFEQFVATVTSYRDFLVFAYGSYERAYLQKMRKRTERKDEVDKILKVLVNILSSIYGHIYFPTYSNGLKDVGACLGCSWTEPNSSGLQSLVWRARWETTQEESWKRKLLTYNLEDCVALRRVTEFIYTHSMPNSVLDQQSATRSGPIVASVDEIDRLGTVNKRGRREFFHAEFDYINKCARFDYQRQRVYVRLGKRRRNVNVRRPKKWRNYKLRVNQRIEITSRTCPSCKSSEIDRLPKGAYGAGRRGPDGMSCCTKHKKAFNLIFTPSGIKRTVIECRAAVYKCLKCGHTFVPERYRRLSKHYHALMSWAMHEHVAHRIGCPVVSDMIREFFGITVYPAEVTRFRQIMARVYESTYKSLLDTILSSAVLQVDETEVRLRNGKGYVWVFTTSEEVIYLYRTTREGDFLHDLLKNFHGVLVTDFYSAYDSIDCPQQKCLLHLMRDMNQELLNMPFDEEYQSITCPFGALLRDIVATVDEHGLKRRHLIKHERDVDKFFVSLDKQSFQSESAETLRARMIKNRDKLFTFIYHDGVPWNNNTPENAIRRFAYYRDGNPGRLKEAGLKEYLVLLSLCQTCHYKDVNFLRYLLSKERDIDSFRQHPKRKRRSAAVEVYPKGVERPDYRRRIVNK